MADKNGGFSGSDMLKGLKNRSPSFPDSSMGIPSGPSVDKDATRDKTAMDIPGETNGRTA